MRHLSTRAILAVGFGLLLAVGCRQAVMTEVPAAPPSEAAAALPSLPQDEEDAPPPAVRLTLAGMGVGEGPFVLPPCHEAKAPEADFGVVRVPAPAADPDTPLPAVVTTPAAAEARPAAEVSLRSAAWAWLVGAFWWVAKALGVMLAVALSLCVVAAIWAWRDERKANAASPSPAPSPAARARTRVRVTAPAVTVLPPPTPVTLGVPTPAPTPVPAPTPAASPTVTTPPVPPPLFVTKSSVPKRGAQLGSGGEATVYEDANDSTRCLKVFTHPPAPHTLAKYRHMIGMEPLKRDPRLAWPHALRGTSRGGCIVIMPRAVGVSAEHLHPATLDRSFPKWRKRHGALIARVACGAAEVIADLHAAGVLMADLHPGNIMVNPETGDIRLIDCDSFQIQGPPAFRSDCHRPEYASPEFLLHKQARDTHSEDYSLAILLFQLLHGFQHPGAAHGVSTPEEAIRRGVFVYATDPARVPAGDWLARWQRQPEAIRNAFTATFHTGHGHSHRRTRASEWARLLRAHETHWANLP